MPDYLSQMLLYHHNLIKFKHSKTFRIGGYVQQPICLKKQIIIFRGVLNEHNKVDGQINYFIFLGDNALVRQNISTFNAVIFTGNKMVKRAMNGIVFARFYFDRQRAKIFVIVDKIINFAFYF